MFFRLIVIKYADRGLAQTGGLSSSLFNYLYILLSVVWCINACFLNLSMLLKKMNMFHPLTKNINLTSNAEHFPHNIRPLGSGSLIPMAGTFVITILISIFFCNVHYLKQKRKNALKMYFQRNVVTFHVNFYFLFSFSF